MLKPLFKRSDPFLQLIILLLMAFFFVSIFFLMAQGLINLLWGVNMFTDPNALKDYTNPQIVNINRVLISFQHVGLFIVPGLIFGRLVEYSAAKFLFLKSRPRIKHLILGSLAMLVAIPLINYLAVLNENMVLPDFMSGIEERIRSMEGNVGELTAALLDTNSYGILLLNIFIVAVLPAIGEEIIFRGALMRILSKWTRSAHWGIWIAAFIFSAIHMQFYGFLPRFLMGAFLGYLFMWSGSLWVPILAHFVNNGLAVLVYFYINNNEVAEEVNNLGANQGDTLYTIASVFLLTGILFYFRKQSRFKEIKSYYLHRDDEDYESENRIE